MNILRLVFIILILTFCVGLFAQSAPAGKKLIEVIVRGSSEASFGINDVVDGKTVNTFGPGVTISIPEYDTVATGETLIMDPNMNSVYTLVGNPKAVHPENILTSNVMNLYNNASNIYLETIGNVKMVNTQKPADDDTTVEITTVTSDKGNYSYNKKEASFSSNVKAVRDSKTVWADDARYLEDTEVLYLNGNIDFRDSNNPELKSTKGIDNGEMLLKDNTNTGVFYPKEGEYIELYFEFEVDE